MKNSAVLVIDVQQGLCEGDGAAFEVEGVIARINSVTRKARRAGVPVLFVQHESQRGYLEFGTAAWQLATGLEVADTDRRIRKTTPDSFLRTELEAVLQQAGIAQQVIAHHNATLTNISSFGPRVQAVANKDVEFENSKAQNICC